MLVLQQARKTVEIGVGLRLSGLLELDSL